MAGTNHIIDNTNSHGGTSFVLSAGDTLLVKQTGSILTGGVAAITGDATANGIQIRIEGRVEAVASAGIALEGTGNTLTVSSTGLLYSNSTVVPSIGQVGTVFNHGSIISGPGGWGAISAGVSLTLCNTGLIQNQSGINFAVQGGSGADFIYNIGTIDGSISLGEGDDFYDGRGGTVSGSISLGLGNNRAYGGAGSETFMGSGYMDGGEGIDTIQAFGSGAVTIDLSKTGPQDTGVFGICTYLNIENVYSSNGADNLTGSAFGNVLQSWGGNDTLNGGGGDDTLNGGSGNDVINGGDGFDTASFYPLSSDGVYVNMANAADTNNTLGQDTFISIELLSGTQFGDTFIGDAGTNGFQGNKGNDTLDGGAGLDTVYYTDAVTVNLATGFAVSGAEGTDTLRNIENASGSGSSDILTGNAFANALFGNDGNDTLNGGDGNDALSGGAGHDMLNGGLGRDTLSGGAGQDVFVFTTKASKYNVDRILDFSVADDTIQLENAVFTKLKAGKLAKGAFWKGAKAHDKDDRVIYDSKKGYLYYDADGSGSKAKQVLIATLTKNLKMTHADFFVI